MTFIDLQSIRSVYLDVSRYLDTYALRNDKKNFLLICAESTVFKSGFHAVILYRIANSLFKNKLHKLAWLVTRLNQAVTAAEIEYNAEIGPGLLIPHPAGIVIGRGTKLGDNVTVYQGVTLGTHNWKKIEYPTIENNVVLFAGAKILGNVTVKSDSIIGANAVITKDIPSKCTAVGYNLIKEKYNES